LTSIIYQEVLQGSDSELSFCRLQRYLSAQIFYFPFHPIQSYTGASQIYRRCREKGITIRSTLDCLIAQVAIEHELSCFTATRISIGWQA
jgi:predicted nucleic acid-binding protein